MIIRRAGKDDKNAMLTSFKPMFQGWDYLPLVIDDWLEDSSEVLTWLAIDESDNNKLIAMAQAYEIEPGDWYLRGLRSNPLSNSFQNGIAVISLSKRIKREVIARGAIQVRYGTLDYYNESLRLGSILGFREHFRLAHGNYAVKPMIKEIDKQLEVTVPDNPDPIHVYLSQGSSLQPVENYFFTWWDTRKMKISYLADAKSENLLFQVKKDGGLTGAAMFWHVPWQKFLVLSVMEGSDDALIVLFNKAMERVHELECTSFGITHPSMAEMHRREELFGLPIYGCFTIQLIRKK